MAKIDYTRILDIPASEFVDDAYYNGNNQELAVDLDGKIYLYQGVPASVANGFETAESAGTYYRTEIKGKYQGSRIGFWSSVDFNHVPAKIGSGVGVADNIATPNEVRNDLGSNSITTNFISTGNLAADTISLKPFADKIENGTLRKHTINFTVGYDSAVKTHTVQAVSVDAAVADLKNVADILGVKTFVREVTVSFV